MEKRLILLVTFLSVVMIAMAQPVSDSDTSESVRSEYCVRGAQYPRITPDHRAQFKVVAPEAKLVQIDLGKKYDLVRNEKGEWLGTAYSFFAWITSITASAWERSIFPFKNARLVNSPGSAGLAPFLITVSRTFLTTNVPPWQLISTVSSPVKVLGALITLTRTSSIVSSLSLINP